MCPVRGVAAQVGCVVTATAFARRGARTGSSSDRVVAGDGLRAMYPALYKGNETTPKGCAVAQ